MVQDVLKLLCMNYSFKKWLTCVLNTNKRTHTQFRGGKMIGWTATQLNSIQLNPDGMFGTHHFCSRFSLLALRFGIDLNMFRLSGLLTYGVVFALLLPASE